MRRASGTKLRELTFNSAAVELGPMQIQQYLSSYEVGQVLWLTIKAYHCYQYILTCLVALVEKVG